MYLSYGYWNDENFNILITALIVLIPFFLIGRLIERH
jgi:hypothetical protein